MSTQHSMREAEKLKWKQRAEVKAQKVREHAEAAARAMDAMGMHVGHAPRHRDHETGVLLRPTVVPHDNTDLAQALLRDGDVHRARGASARELRDLHRELHRPRLYVYRNSSRIKSSRILWTHTHRIFLFCCC